MRKIKDAIIYISFGYVSVQLIRSFASLGRELVAAEKRRSSR